MSDELDSADAAGVVTPQRPTGKRSRRRALETTADESSEATLEAADSDTGDTGAVAVKVKPAKKAGNPGHGDEQWSQVRAHWEECRSVKQTAEHFGLSPNTIKTRSRREGWGK